MDLATVDELLTTTRAVRKRLDLTRPVEPEVIEECLELALQAPSASNSQRWHFMVLTDEQQRRGIAELYQQSWASYGGRARQQYPAGDPRAAALPRVLDSATYLSAHMHEVPVLVIPCLEIGEAPDRASRTASMWGSILPATWSFMLALRSRGLGSAWTTIHIDHEEEARAILGIPEGVLQAALIPVAYYTGESFRRAPRLPAAEVTSWNRWGERR